MKKYTLLLLLIAVSCFAADTVPKNPGVDAMGTPAKPWGYMYTSDHAYNATTWDGSLRVPTENAVRDKIESMSTGGGTSVTLNAAANTILGLSTQEITLDVQNANKVWAGPTTGADATPTFRTLVTSDLLNIGIVAADPIWDASGDIAVGTGANTAARVAIGSEGQVLTVGSANNVTWATPGASGGNITSINATLPLVASGNATVSISMPAATSNAHGYATLTQIGKLNGIAAGATNYAHPTGDGNLHVPATGTTNNGNVLTAGASAGNFTWATPSAGSSLERVNIKDFGAISGDLSGAVNNTTAITDAYEYSRTNHKVLFVPAGNYYIGSSITLHGWVQIEGEGASSMIYTDQNIPMFVIDVTTEASAYIKINKLTFGAYISGTRASNSGIQVIGGAGVWGPNTSEFCDLLFLGTYHCFRFSKNSHVAESMHDWNRFNNITTANYSDQSPQYSFLFENGSGTGNVFTNLSLNAVYPFRWQVTAQTAPDVVAGIGDIVVSNIQTGGATVAMSGAANAAYRQRITVNGYQFDAGTGTPTGLEFTDYGYITAVGVLGGNYANNLTNCTNTVLVGNGTVYPGGAGNSTPGGSNTQVQFNDSGAFGGDAGLTYSKTLDTLTTNRLALNGSGRPLAFIGDDGNGHNWIRVGADDEAHVLLDLVYSGPGALWNTAGSNAILVKGGDTSNTYKYGPVSMFMSGRYWDGSVSTNRDIELENKIMSNGEQEFWIEFARGGLTSVPIFRMEQGTSRAGSAPVAKIKTHGLPYSAIEFWANDLSGAESFGKIFEYDAYGVKIAAGETLNVQNLTASLPVFTDASKNLVSKSIADTRTAMSLATDQNATFNAVLVQTSVNALLSDGFLPYHVNDSTGLANSVIYTDGYSVRVGETGHTDHYLNVNGYLKSSQLSGSNNRIPYADSTGVLGNTNISYDGTNYAIGGTSYLGRLKMNVASGLNLSFRSIGSSAVIEAVNDNNGADVPLALYSTSTTIASLAGSGSRAVYSDANGLLSAPASDATLKIDIEPIAYGINDVMKLNPIGYNWINKDKYGPQHEVGFTAQEVEKVIPELVSKNNDGTLSLDYSKMVSVLVKAIQDQQKQIEELKARTPRIPEYSHPINGYLLFEQDAIIHLSQ